MATGRQAFQGNTTAVVFDAILNRMPPPAASVNPEVPPELERIIDKAIEKDRDLRYQSAADIRSDLQRLKRARESGSAAYAAAQSASHTPAGASGVRPVAGAWPSTPGVAPRRARRPARQRRLRPPAGMAARGDPAAPYRRQWRSQPARRRPRRPQKKSGAGLMAGRSRRAADPRRRRLRGLAADASVGTGGDGGRPQDARALARVATSCSGASRRGARRPRARDASAGGHDVYARASRATSSARRQAQARRDGDKQGMRLARARRNRPSAPRRKRAEGT